MTEDVLVSIRGLQMNGEDQEDQMEIVMQGKYLCMDGRHYIRCEELVEGMDGTIQNLIRVDENGMEVTRRGLTNAHMVFEKDKKNITCYETPFGSLMVGIFATNVDVREGGRNLDVKVNYALDINDEHFADCAVTVNVQAKEQPSAL